MHLKSAIFVYLLIKLSNSQDVTNFDLSVIDENEWSDFDNSEFDKRPDRKKHVDIYTNYNDHNEVLKNYNRYHNKDRYNFKYKPITKENGLKNKNDRFEDKDIFQTDFRNANFKYVRHPTLEKPDLDNQEAYNPIETNFGQVSDQFRNGKYIYNFKKITDPQEIESDFGVFVQDQHSLDQNLNEANISHTFRRPRFKTQNYNDVSRPWHSGYVQKVTRFDRHRPRNTTRERINNILKRYMNKIYNRKFSNNTRPSTYESLPIDGDEEDHKSKFFDESLWNLKNKTKKLKHQFLSLFQIIQFDNSQCQASGSTSDYLGVCYHESQCMNLNGTPLGNCAEGYGVCCVFRSSCGGSSSQNCSYFESPGYPNYWPPDGGVLPPATSTTTTQASVSPDPRLPLIYQYMNEHWARQSADTFSCTYQVNKLSPDIQQMRIDFLDLELRGPTNGTCIEERLVISGQNVNNQIPILCGYNTGQHVYIDVSRLTGPLQLSVLSNTMDRKRFRIRICQIPAASCSMASNCLQYYTGTSGTISTFNYDQSSSFNRSTPGYFNNLNYAICIRREAGYCSITYTNVASGLEYPFQFVNSNNAGQSTVPPGQAGIEAFNCPNDYIIVGGVRLCGNRFNDDTANHDLTMNAPVTDVGAGPIVVSVRTNQAGTGRGARLFYTQNRCTTMK